MSATLTTPKTTSGGEIIRELVNASDGAGLHFDGTNGFIDIASPPDLGSKFSFEFIFKASTWTSGNIKILFDFEGSGDNRFMLRTNASGNNLRIYDGTTDVDTGVVIFDDLAVHHVVVTVDGTAAVVYDNGNQVATATISASHGLDNATDARIGSDVAGRRPNGTFYRARFYNHTLSSTEVQTAYERADVDFSSQYGSQTSLVDAGASVFTSGTYSWSAYGSNTIANVGNALEVTYVNHASGASNGLRNSSDLTTDLIVGKRYRLTVDAKYTGGSAGSKLQLALAGSNTDFATLTTSLVTYTYEFTTDTATGGGFRMSGMSAGNVVTIDNWYLREIGCVSDYDLAFANENQSRMVADRSTNNVDGEMSSSGVKQTQVIKQLNSTAMRVGGTSATAATPADGDIIADKVGAGIAPAAPLHAKTAATTGSSPLEVARLEVKDEGVNLGVGMGPKLAFYMPHDAGSFEGAAIAAKKEATSDSNEATSLSFSTIPNAFGAPVERLTIDSTGNVKIGSTSAVDTQLSVECDTTGEAIGDGIRIHNAHGINGDIAPIYFGVHGGTRRAKAAIGLKRTGSYGIGELRFALDSNSTDTDVNFADDTKLMIDSTGLCTFSAGVTVSGGILALTDSSGGALPVLTISSGEITITSSVHQVEVESGTTDDLIKINGGTVGAIVMLRSQTSNTVVVKDQASGGNFLLAGDFSMSSNHDTITLLKTGTYWQEISRSDNA